MVRQSIHEAPPAHCRFTCSEGLPISNNFAKMQIMPGMDCTVKLAGELAFTGKVETRQVYYDASRHHIEIMCAGLMDAITSSVIHKTSEWKNETIEKVLKPQLQRVGINLIFEGGPAPSYKFKRISSIPGETIFDLADMMARHLGVHFATNPKGDMVGIVGPSGGSDKVTEGVNILIGREILFRPSITSYIPAATQGTGDNKDHGAKVAHMPFNQEAMDKFMSTTFGTAPALVRSELATSDKKMLQGRTDTESQFMEGDKITVFATVQGFLRPSGGLWERNQEVVVNSPMLVMKGRSLRVKNVVFTQDNQTGSRTLLELCNPAAMGKIPTGAVQ